MMTGTWYRGFHLKRIGWDDLWTINDSPSGTWNETVLAVDKVATEPVPPRVTCSICGLIEVLHWNSDTNNDLLKECLCFECDFWLKRARLVVQPNHVAVKNSAYMIQEDEQGNRRWSGFGGREFHIKFFDGREVITHNLWHQGKIPLRFQSLIPNNAEFLHATEKKEEQ